MISISKTANILPNGDFLGVGIMGFGGKAWEKPDDSGVDEIGGGVEVKDGGEGG